MKKARILVLTIALIAGGLAAYLASGIGDRPPPIQQIAMQTVDVLVAKSDIGLGQTVTAEAMQWQTWPAGTASASLIRRNDRPDATTQIAGSIARAPFIAGEPIREPKLVKANGSGFMAAILPTGMRAVSTEISAENGAGGFILPNDRVDVMLSKREKDNTVTSQVVLANVRVLAIDQSPKESDGRNAVVGKTATLELTPGEAEILARARQSGTLSLALRSMADGGKSADVVATVDNTLITVTRGIDGRQDVYSCNPLCGQGQK